MPESTKAKSKRLRKAFREGVLRRDGNACRVCGKKDVPLDAHHIVDRHELLNDGYALSNGISLCAACHLLAEEYHISEGSYWGIGFHPNDLYCLIGSSQEKARQDSLVLR